MRISLKDVGKRYNRDWIFRNVNFEFLAGEAYAILGSNGSGKSTLLQVIAGNQLSSEGTVSYYQEQKQISAENIYSSLGFASPYLELIEEFTLLEQLHFQLQFKPFFASLSIPEMLEITGLEKSKDKAIKYFSSGMKQRLRLALAILSNSSILLLDEPTSNLDKNGINWYNSLIQNYKSNRILIVCSNHQLQEYEFCKQQLSMEDFKS
jgi:ABC-type multidrug transport system ATPase subunit